MKEGSKYEDLAIIAHLWTLMDKIQNELKPDVSNAVESLWKFGQDENAIVLCENIEKLLQTADRCIQEVWSTPITEEVLGNFILLFCFKNSSNSKISFSLLHNVALKYILPLQNPNFEYHQ